MSSLLIYGIVGTEAGNDVKLDGLADGARLIADGDIAAIVGASPPASEFQGLAREDAMRRLLQYQRVLEAAIVRTAVLPVKFGTVAPDEPAVRRMLIQGHKLLAAQLQQFTGRLQMDVAVEWPLNEIFVEIASEAGISELRARAIASDDADAKVLLGTAVKAALDARRAKLSAGICETLRLAVQDITANPLADERAVANIALLIAREGIDALYATLDRLDADHGGKLKFRCIGPLAPSAFATVEVNFPPRDAVEHAWHTLQLGARATAAEIKTSYFRLARELHPDAAHGGGQSAAMDELAKAHRLLMACAKTSGEELQLNGPALLAINIARPAQPAGSAACAGQEAAA